MYLFNFIFVYKRNGKILRIQWKIVYCHCLEWSWFRFMKAVVIQGASASKRIHSRIYITAEIGAVHEP